MPQPLAQQHVEQGQRLVRRFATLNGVTVALLMDNMLILYAIRVGLSDTAVAILTSFIFLTMPLMLVGKRWTARSGAAHTWGTGWILRNSSALIMLLAPFVPDGTTQGFRTALVLLGAFGFAAFRSIGLVGNSPIMGEITTSTERGRFMSGNWTRATVTQIISLIVVITVLRFSPETWVFQLLIAAGAAVGIYVGALLRRVPESGAPRASASKPAREIMSRVWRAPRLRKTLYAWAVSFASFNLVLPFAMITVKNGYGLSDYQALLLSLVTLAGGVTASLVNGVVADRVGPRPLAIVYVALLLVLALFWSFAPAELVVGPTALAFFLAGYSKFGLLLVTNHYFLNVSEASDRVGTSMVLRIVSGAVAGLIGGVLGGVILTILRSVGLSGMDVYRGFYRIAVLAIAAMLPVMVRLDKLDEWPLSRAALLLLRPRIILRMHQERRNSA